MSKKGFTLIEMVLSMVILVMITSSLGLYIMKGIDAWLLLRTRNALQAEAKVSITRMMNEFRTIPSANDVSIIYPTE